MSKEKKVMSITIGLVCVLLVAVMFAQFRTIEKTDVAGIENAREEELRTMIANWKTKYDETEKKIEETNQKIEEYKSTTASTRETEDLLDEELLQTNKLVGKTEVTGEGVIVTLTDNINKKIEDTDLLFLMNELKLAGAEAISINDKRIINMSDIVMVNEIILINGERVTSPYVVKAIGDQKYLSSSLSIKNSGYIDKYTNSGKTVSMSQEKNIRIQAYNNANNLMEFKYIKEVEQ